MLLFCYLPESFPISCSPSRHWSAEQHQCAEANSGKLLFLLFCIFIYSHLFCFQNIKNILGLKSAGNAENNITALKQQAASELTNKPSFSKIPVLRSRIFTAGQKENKIPVEALQSGKLGIAKPEIPLVKVEPKPVIENIDNDSNCFLLSEYAPEIYQYLRQVEVCFRLFVVTLSFVAYYNNF